MNQHCGRHDKVFSEASPCPGCANEAKGVYVSSAEQTLQDEQNAALDRHFASLDPEPEPVPVTTSKETPAPDTEAMLQRILSGFESKLRNALKR